MKTISLFPLLAATLSVLAAPAPKPSAPGLEERFHKVPREDRLAVFWDWSNAIDKPAITRDLEAMAHAGIGRAVLSALLLSHSANRDEGGIVFLSPQFLELFRFALDEAARLGIQITALPSNGWYQGGPWVTPDMGAQMLVWSEKSLKGPADFSGKLPAPDKHRTSPRARIARDVLPHFKAVATLAFRKNAAGRLLADSMTDLTSLTQPDGTLDWKVPDGEWVLYRFGHVPNMVRMKNDAAGYGGLQIDHLSRPAMQRYLETVAVPMLRAAGPHVGKTLDRLHEDSIELGHYDWTPDLPAQFRKRTGHDIIPLLPVLAGASFADGPEPARVEHDFEQTLDDLLIDEHFGAFREFCHAHGVTLVSESGATGNTIQVKGAPVDHVMDEFWTHRTQTTDHAVCFNRNAVFASHVYGQNRNTHEAFTSHQQWFETPAQLKAIVNEAYALGANHLTIHGYSSSPLKTPPPGDVFFAGTHFNPGVTWWKDYAAPLVAYFNRCHTLLTAGLPVTDLLYLDGRTLQEMNKSNEMLRETARRFWKFDGIPADLFAEKASTDAVGRIALPNGQTYSVLVVADQEIPLGVMRVVEKLVQQGATVWFQAVPDHSPRHADGPEADKEIQAIAQRLGAGNPPGLHPNGKGRILTGADRSRIVKLGSGISSRTYCDGLHAAAMDPLGIAPAFSYEPDKPETRLYFFQRQADGADIYFVANPARETVRAGCTFRVAGKQPECWDPVTGKISPLTDFTASGSSTTLPLELAAHESVFILFRKPGAPPRDRTAVEKASPSTTPVEGGWTLAFDPAREGLESFEIQTDQLFRWDQSKDERIRTFSGTAAYRKDFVLPESQISNRKSQILLDLGTPPTLYELTGAGGGGYSIRDDAYDALCAEVLVNGKSAGVLWCAPYQVDVTHLVQAGSNTLEIRVTNTWHNWRLAGQFTAGKHPWEKKGLALPPAPSGLPGPVRIESRAATRQPPD
jgi:hypothetical protein